jgi:hypothetical protein
MSTAGSGMVSGVTGGMGGRGLSYDTFASSGSDSVDLSGTAILTAKGDLVEIGFPLVISAMLLGDNDGDCDTAPLSKDIPL